MAQVERGNTQYCKVKIHGEVHVVVSKECDKMTVKVNVVLICIHINQQFNKKNTTQQNNLKILLIMLI